MTKLTATKFYAIADINGPISVRIDAETASEAREWFLAQDANFGDDCRADAESDLEICGDGMSHAEFSDAMQAKGYSVVDSDLCGDSGWGLWELSKGENDDNLAK